MNEIKPKSHRYAEKGGDQEMTNPEKKIEPIVSAKVRTKKKGLLQKAAGLLLPEDIADMRVNLKQEVLIPCFKDTVMDVLHVMFYGERGTKGGATYRNNVPRVSYQNYYNNQNANRRDYNQVHARPGYELLELIFDTRGEALDVLTTLDDIINRYGVVSVADYYEVASVQSNYTDTKYGWKDIRSADTVSIRGGGFTIRMPRPMPLE